MAPIEPEDSNLRGAELHNYGSNNISDKELLLEPNICEENEVETDYKKFIVKNLRTFFIVLSFMPIGLGFDMVAQALPYLKDRVGVSYDEISQLLLSRNLGFLLAPLFVGIIYDAIPSQHSNIFLSIWYILDAISTALIPRLSFLTEMNCLIFIQGASAIILITSDSTEIFRLWGDKGGTLFLTQHFLFGVGAMLSPLVVDAYIRVPSPALSENASTHDLRHSMPGKLSLMNITNIFGNSNISPSNTGGFEKASTLLSWNGTETLTVADVEYPYIIAGLQTGFFGLLFFVFHCLEHFSEEKTLKTDVNTKQTLIDMCNLFKRAKSEYSLFEIVHMICIAIFCFHSYGNENALRGYLYSYAVESTYAFSSTEASALNTYFWLACLVGRLGNIVAAAYCHYPTIFGVMVVAGLTNVLVLAILGSVNQTVLYICIISFGTFNASLFTGSVIFATHYVEMNAFKFGTRLAGASLGATVYQELTGNLFEKYGPQSIMYILFGGGINILLMYTILLFIGNKWATKK